MNKRKSTTVRLTDQAHILLSDKADNYHSEGHDISMKDNVTKTPSFLSVLQCRSRNYSGCYFGGNGIR
jgi:hypothetical protein